jgi:hypothetical protein
LRKVAIILQNILVILFSLFLLGASTLPPAEDLEKVRSYTRQIEFDFINWMGNAFLVKNQQAAINLPQFMTDKGQTNLVKNYLALQRDIILTEDKIEQNYSNPDITDPQAASAADREKLNDLHDQLSYIGPLSETILQSQVSAEVAKAGLSLGGQPLPPVLYHITPLPYALIVSPRNVIRQDANISLLPDLTLEQMIALENEVEKNLDVSALVVPVGGIGVYPTMVMRTTDLSYLTEVIAHEWTHNFLTLRPLGINYDTTPQLRTMNETAASITGSEIGLQVLKDYYPEEVPPPSPPEPSTENDQGNNFQPIKPLLFSFRKEMHTTRVTVDNLLKDGKIKEAEEYMETRRRIFWDHGYQIRRLNQAYFAFNGAYADLPGGAAGSDPVGPAVRGLRKQSPNLATFLNRISWMTSFEQLQQTVGKVPIDQ